MRLPKPKSFAGLGSVLMALLLISFGLFPSGCSEKTDLESLTKRLNHKKAEVRMEAALALGNLRNHRAVDPLITTLKTDKEPQVREYAARALGQIGNPRATKPLLDAALRRKIRWKSAVRALANIDDPRAVDILVELLKSKSPRLRYNAAAALGEIKDPRAIEPLCVVFLNDRDLVVREAGAEALAQIAESVDDALVDSLCKDLKFVAATYPFFIVRGDYRRQPVLIEALNRFGDETMAEVFLNCGNLSLAEAAEGWAELHGYRILKRPGTATYQWGSKPKK
jgi:hypothetical protein